MPVLVTDAHRPLSRLLVARLLDEGGEVRAYGDGDVSGLRAAGAFVAVGTSDDEGRLEAALAEVHTLVHVGGGLLSPPERIVEDARVVARAAANAGIRRILALSLPGAHPNAGDPLRRAKAAAEAALAEVACPTVVIRTSLIDTPAVRDALATSITDPSLRDVEVAPVRPGDLLELLAAFDRARSRATEGHLLVAADGPVRLSVAAYLERVGVRAPGGGSLVGRRLVDEDHARRLADALRGPWWTDDATVLDGWRFADVDPAAPGHGAAGGQR